MKYLYYPGCSQKASSRSFETSFLAVCSRLGVELVELEDWNCCGATMAISCDKVLSLALAARNLALAEKEGLPLVTPCPSCRLAFLKVQKVLESEPAVARKVRDALAAGGWTLKGGVKVLHVLEFLAGEIGREKLEEQVTKPLRGVRMAPYYGCQAVRPWAVAGDEDDPQTLETILGALGAETVGFAHRTSCCGSSLMVTGKEKALGMSRRILTSLRGAGADILVTPCGLCQVNMELAQRGGGAGGSGKSPVPSLNVTQAVGLALGISPGKLGVSRSVASVIDNIISGEKGDAPSRKVGVASVS